MPSGAVPAHGVDGTLGILVLVLPCSSQLAVFSTSSGRKLGETIVPRAGNYLHELPIDTKRHLVFLAGEGSIGGSNTVDVYSLTALIAGARSLVATIDVPSAGVVAASGASAGNPSAVAGQSASDPTGPLGDVALAPTGAYDDPTTNVLYLTEYEDWGNNPSYTSARGPGNQDVYLVGVDVGRRLVKWSLALDHCASPANRGGLRDEPLALARLRGGADLAVGCLTAKASPASGTSGGATGGNGYFGTGVSITGFGSMLSYRVPLDGHGNPARTLITYRLGRTNAAYGIGGPGSGRLFWVTSPPFDSGTASDAGPAAVVYDPVHDAYVAAPTIGAPSVADGDGFALAADEDRLYAAGPDGFTLVDTHAEGGQGSVFQGFACRADMIAVDRRLRRLFVLPEGGCAHPGSSAPDPPYLLIYQDDVADLSPPQAPAPDSYTKQIAERAGVTAAAFNGHTEATAVRLRLIGDTTGLLRGLSFGASHALEAPMQQRGVAPDTGTRELELAAIKLADLDNYHSGADATPAAADDTTATQASGIGGSWPFGATSDAACSAPGSASGRESFASDTSATVACSAGSPGTQASAEAGLFSLLLLAVGQKPAVDDFATLPMRVGHSEASTRVWRDAHAGLTAQSESTVHGIELGPITINTVSTRSTCEAHGRAGTAKCSFARRVIGVTVSGEPDVPSGCVDTVSDGKTQNGCVALLSALNAVYPPYLSFGMSLPDQRLDYLPGSPGGYQAVAERPYYEHLYDNFINYDGSLEVSGLSVLYVNDSAQSPSRLDLQLASISAESRYGIDTAGSCVLECVPDHPPAEPASILSAPAHEPLTALSSSKSDGHTQAGVAGDGSPFELVRRVVAGVAWFVRSPAQAGVIALLLTLLGSPLALARRRQRLEALNG